MIWTWQDAMAKKDRQVIFDDLTCDDSIIFDLAKEDVLKILKTTNYCFAIKLGYNEIYSSAVAITKMQIEKIITRKSGFLFSKDSCDFENSLVIQKVVARIVNNIKNLFNDKYKSCISNNLKENFLRNQYVSLEEDDALSAILKEEDEAIFEATKNKAQVEYVDTLLALLKIEKNQNGNQQLFLNFDGDAA